MTKFTLPDGTIVEATKLIKPVGQFTHWYMDRNGEPRYLIVREAHQQSYVFNEDVNAALTAAMASGRYMIVVFTVDAADNGADQRLTLRRVANQFPYEGFEFCKNELAKNLDSEYTPPQPLQIADIVNQMPAQQVGPSEPLDLQEHNSQMNESLIAQLQKMNQQADADGTTKPAGGVDSDLVVAAKPD